MAKDQMQEVYPVLETYVDGEQPTANKQNAVLKQTKASFDSITQAVGDPWDAQDHGYTLSPQNLSVPSLARMIGPTDYLGYAGSFNESTTIDCTLANDRNAWALGFPLIKTVATITPTSGLSAITALDWSTDVVVSLTGSDSDLFTTEKTSRSALTERGDFFIDYYRGEIITYDAAQYTIRLELSNLNMMGPGAPWATNNVIPTWDQSGSNLCDIAHVSTGGGTSTYTLTLPVVKKAPRAGSLASNGGVVSHSLDPVNQTYVTFDNLYNEDTDYRLPPSIIEAGLSSGEVIPEGFFLLWDDTLSRVVPRVEFRWESGEHTLTLVTPESWLTVSSDRYRLIHTASSLAESVGWLMAAYRDNRHIGLMEGSALKNTLSFTNPISHKDLADRFNGFVDESYTKKEALLFRESSLPTNDHPQYLHRYGYVTADDDGNSGNAMRGWLVFTAQKEYDLSLEKSDDTKTKYYGLRFGGDTNSSTLYFDGGEDVTDWSSGAPLRSPFQSTFMAGTYSGGNRMGSLSYFPWSGAPLYLKGRATSEEHNVATDGAALPQFCSTIPQIPA